MPTLSHIRNFSIIAHIDHGKSTLADRMLQITHTVADREFRDQLLDDMDLERERGITIKSHPVTMNYKSLNNKHYELNLIDTPGHVDFSYEVSRSLAACEGALLIIDAAQGVEAQTVANTYMALDKDLAIIPVINKIDLQNANVELVRNQIEDVLGIDASEVYCVSAKTGDGVRDLLEAIVNKVPPPSPPNKGEGIRALVTDSQYDLFRGVIAHARVFNGPLAQGDEITLMQEAIETEIKEVGRFFPKPRKVEKLDSGQVGYIVSSIKDPLSVRIGDTVTLTSSPAPEPLPGFKEIHPVVFSGLYPVNTGDYERFKDGLQKLRLNDSSFVYHPETSAVLGFGFRCGFLGLLHMEIIYERLRREFDLDVISTQPAVEYKVHLTDRTVQEIDNPLHMPDESKIDEIEEPKIRAYIVCMNHQIGDIMKLTMERRGRLTHTESMGTQRVMLTCDMPLNEVLTDFHDNLKSVSRGYASMDYEHTGYEPSDIVKLDILINGEVIDAFSTLVHRSKAEAKGRQICLSLKDAVPQHLFAVPLQASIGKRIVARETIKALRKDVTAKLYGGDVTRKRKLLEKQKEGKKKMKQFGKVNVPQEAFLTVMKS
jgi:GTP-binding protein LepA